MGLFIRCLWYTPFLLPFFCQTAPGPRPRHSTNPAFCRFLSTFRTISRLTPMHARSSSTRRNSPDDLLQRLPCRLPGSITNKTDSYDIIFTMVHFLEPAQGHDYVIPFNYLSPPMVNTAIYMNLLRSVAVCKIEVKRSNLGSL